MEEAVFALVRMFQAYTFQLAPSHHTSPARARTGPTLGAEGGIWLTVKPRSASTA